MRQCLLNLQKLLAMSARKKSCALGANNAKAGAQWQELPSPEVEKGKNRI